MYNILLLAVYCTNAPDITPGTSDENILLSIITYMEENENGIDNITLYGKYCVKYEVTLITTIPDGSASETIIYVENGSNLDSVAAFNNLNSELTAKNTNISFAYKFEGWNDKDENGNEYETSSIINSDLTLYASWTKKEYSLTINYSYDDGNSKESVSYYYNKNEAENEAKIDIPVIEEPTGYRTEYSYSNIDENGKFSSEKTKASITVYYKKLYKVTVESDTSLVGTGGGKLSKYSINGGELKTYNNEEIYVCKDDKLTVEIEYNANNQRSITITEGTETTKFSGSSSPEEYTYTIKGTGEAEIEIKITSRRFVIK